MTYPTLTAVVSTIASRTLGSAERWSQALESLFSEPAALGGQFEAQLVIPDLDETLPGFVVVQKLDNCFNLAFTQDPDFLEKGAR